MKLKGSQKFAILLCKFKNRGNVISPSKVFFENLFLNTGTGGQNDYWNSVSHGNINLNGSKVFDWKEIDHNLNDFLTANPTRGDKISAALSNFPEVVRAEYKGIVAIYNENLGDGGSLGINTGILAGPIDWNNTFLAHEMGHVLGFEHSFDQSARKTNPWSQPGEYFDMHDIMSAKNVFAFTGTNPEFSPSGPLLNAANMDLMGWLDTSRTWTRSTLYSTTYYQFKLVSLGHPEIPGYLAAKIGSLYIEFRTPDGWDAGIPRPCVLIHELNHINSIVLASDLPNNVNDWQSGQFYGSNDALWNSMGGSRIYIDSFDLNGKTATITVRYKTPREFEDQYILPDWKEFKRTPGLLIFEIVQGLKEELFKTRKELFDTKNEVFELKKELSNTLFNIHKDVLDIKNFGRGKMH